MKICSNCKTEKSLLYFSKNGKYYRSHCKECCAKAKKDIYEQTRQDKVNYVNEYRTPCLKCGEERKYLIDFHHVNRENKAYTITAILNSGVGFDAFKRKFDIEVAKCVPLCSNCHREFHHFERENDLKLDEYLFQ